MYTKELSVLNHSLLGRIFLRVEVELPRQLKSLFFTLLVEEGRKGGSCETCNWWAVGYVPSFPFTVGKVLDLL